MSFIETKWRNLQRLRVSDKEYFKSLTKSELLAERFESQEQNRTDAFTRIVSWRLRTYELLEYSVSNVESILEHVSLAKEMPLRSINQSNEWGFRKFLFGNELFPEEEILSQICIKYRKWKYEIYKRIPKDKLLNRKQRQKNTIVQLRCNLGKLPNFDWLQKRVLYAKKHFINIKSDEIDAIFELMMAVEPLAQQAIIYLKEAKELQEQRRIGKKILQRLPFGLSGFEVRKFRTLCEQADLHPIVIPEAVKLGMLLDDYFFVAEATKILFKSNKKSLPMALSHEKLSALVDTIPLRHKERFQKTRAATTEEIKERTERDMTDQTFIFQVLRFELASRDINISAKTISLLEETMDVKRVPTTHARNKKYNNQGSSIIPKPKKSCRSHGLMKLNRDKPENENLENQSITHRHADKMVVSQTKNIKQVEVIDLSDEVFTTPPEPKRLPEAKLSCAPLLKRTKFTLEPENIAKNTLEEKVSNVDKEKFLPSWKQSKNQESIIFSGKKQKVASAMDPYALVIQTNLPNAKANTKKIEKMKNVAYDCTPNVNKLDMVTPNIESKEQLYYAQAKRSLLEMSFPFEFSHGWLLCIGNISLKNEYQRKSMFFPIGYTAAFKYIDISNTRDITMYRFEIHEGPIFQVSYIDTSSKTLKIIKRTCLRGITEVMSSVTDEKFDICTTVGFRCRKIRFAMEGLPYARQLKVYVPLNKQSALCHSVKETKRLLLTSADFQNIPKPPKPPTKTRESRTPYQTKPRKYNQALSQGKRMFKTKFKLTDFETFGKILRNSFAKVGQQIKKKMQNYDISMIIPGILSDGNCPNKMEFSAVKSMVKNFQQIFNSLNTQGEKTQFDITPNFEPCFELCLNVIEEVKRQKIKPNKCLLPKYQPYYDDNFILTIDIDGIMRKVDLNLDNNQLGKNIYILYKQKLSTLPCDIFNSSDCICGHDYHSPRITFCITKATAVVTSVTLCLSTIAFVSKEKDILVIEVEGLATDDKFERRGFASVLLVVLRAVAKDIERYLNVEVAMVAKTSTESEMWWSSRKCFFRSLREIKKQPGFSTEDYSRWKKWVEESGARNHQFFNHQESRGKSAFWVSKFDNISSDNQATINENLQKSLKKLEKYEKRTTTVVLTSTNLSGFDNPTIALSV